MTAEALDTRAFRNLGLGSVAKLTVIPGNSVPDKLVSSTIEARDGTQLRVARTFGTGAKGTAVIVPGRGDFIERYFETIRDLQRRGYAVAIYDPRGQGGSQRPLRNPYRSRLGSFAEYDDDLSSFMAHTVLPHCPRPFLALGHSTGGHVVLRSLRQQEWFAKAVITAPLLGVQTGSWPMPVARGLTALMSHSQLGWMFLPGQQRRPLTALGFEGNSFTSDQDRFMRDTAILAANPSLGLGGPSFSWLRAAFRSIDELHALQQGTALKSPVLIIAAGRDKIVDNEATHRFVRRVANASLAIIPEARHEILADSDAVRAQFFAAFDAFTAE